MAPRVWREGGKTWFEHECRSGTILEYSLPDVIWTVVSEHPLTLRTLVNCGFCGLRGQVVAGEWVSLANG